MPPNYIHKPRHYLHFDPPPSNRAAEELATTPERVARHSFYPFLGFTVKTLKVQVDGAGNFCRKSKKRPIKLAAHCDSAIYGHYARILGALYEAQVTVRGLGSCILAFRRAGGPGRNNISFAKEAFDFIEQNRPCVAIGLDVEKFFDRLDHATLKERWCATLGVSRLPADHFNLFCNLTNFAWVDRDRAYKACGISPHNPKPKNTWRSRICTPRVFRERIREGGLIWDNPERGANRGIPQGAPISALLSNIYMLDFDTSMNAAVARYGGFYRRYCDDIIVVVPPNAKDAIEALAAEKISLLKLSINAAKTTCASFPAAQRAPANGGESTQFLGFTFDGVRRLIRASSLTRYYSKMRAGVKLARQTWRKHNKMEWEQGRPLSGMKTRQLFIRYSYLIGRRFQRRDGGHERQGENFLTYAYRSSKEMNAPEIKKQVRNHLAKLKTAIRQAQAPDDF